MADRMEITREIVAIDEPRNETQTETPERSGAEAMRQSADRVLKESSDKICKALLECAIRGRLMAARLLYLIAVDQFKGKAVDLNRALLVAEEWAADKQWLAEVTKPPAETTNCDCEPE